MENTKYQKQINPETNKSYPEDNWVWSPQGVVNMHYPEMWGYVQFSIETVGNANISFVEKEDEAAKWYLRQVYYNEKKYFQENGTYTNKTADLKIKINYVPGFVMPSEIEFTAGMFEASLQSEDGSFKISIDDNGLIWKTLLIK